MTKESKAIIFLAEQRGMKESDAFRSLYTFSYGDYYNPHKTLFNGLYAVNDDVLDGGRSLEAEVGEHSFILLLPVSGAIAYQDSIGRKCLLAAGQSHLLSACKGTGFSISNPFTDRPVNFLQVWVKAGEPPVSQLNLSSTYNVNQQPDKLTAIVGQAKSEPHLPFAALLGKFKGRGETTYTPKPGAGIFAFVLEGAFELEGRLLHARDGLAIWNTDSIDMEALSNDALLLLLELPDQNNFLLK